MAMVSCSATTLRERRDQAPSYAPSTRATFMALATALKLQRPSDIAYGHAVDQALRALHSDLMYAFSGAELCLLIPQSDASSGCWRWTDGVSCSCGPNQSSLCWHALLYRLLCAAAALVDPANLRAQLLDQGGTHGSTTPANDSEEERP
jgi:hypothetical protein